MKELHILVMFTTTLPYIVVRLASRMWKERPVITI